MKKRYVALFLVFAMTVGGFTAHASGLLNLNLLELIRGKANTETQSGLAEIDSNLEGNKAEYISEISNLVQADLSEIETEIEKTKKAEIEAANNEINAYIESIEIELDSAKEIEIKNSKEKLKTEKDKKVNEVKQAIMEVLELELKK